MVEKDMDYYTKVYFTQFETGSIELAFKSSLHPNRTAIKIKDLPALKNIHAQIGDVIKEIYEDGRLGALVEIPEDLQPTDPLRAIASAMGISYEQAVRDYEGQVVLAGLTDELHKRLHVQARNLLYEYRLSPSKSVPVEKVEDLMRLYGNLIAKLIWEKQKGTM